MAKWEEQLKRIDFAAASIASMFDAGSYKKEIAELAVDGIRERLRHIAKLVNQWGYEVGQGRIKVTLPPES